jgi:hypothetical protein
MASTYSTNLKIELIGTGEQAGTWGTTTNSNLGTALEQAIVGKADVTMSSATITLTLTNSNAAQDARAIYLNLTGSPGGAAVLEVPAIEKPYIVKNGSDQEVTIKVSGQTPVLGTPTSGTLSNCTVDGTDAVGFRNTPVNSQSGAYTLVLADSGKTILHPSADTTARTFTIPANSSVAYPVGTVLTFVNQNGAGVVTIAITTDTMRLSPAGTTGSRTLAANGVATCVKLTSTEWIITGSGLT